MAERREKQDNQEVAGLLPGSPTSLNEVGNWPASLRSVRSSVRSALLEITIDVLLFVLSVLLLVFGLVIEYYKQKPVAAHRHATEILLSATKYV